MKHTPGPWQAEGNEIWHRGTGYNDESDPHTYICDVVHLANRSLIVAAPDMLDALQEIEKSLVDIGGIIGSAMGYGEELDLGNLAGELDRLYLVVVDAINKAKGEGA